MKPAVINDVDSIKDEILQIASYFGFNGELKDISEFPTFFTVEPYKLFGTIDEQCIRDLNNHTLAYLQMMINCIEHIKENFEAIDIINSLANNGMDEEALNSEQRVVWDKMKNDVYDIFNIYNQPETE